MAGGSLSATVTEYLAFLILAQIDLGNYEFLILDGRDMADTTQAQVADLPVPGARLHYKARGSGPLLLLLQGGDGDADGTDALAGHLASDYTVLSYDRRGLSRSPVSYLAAAIDMAAHSEDASRLLAVVTSDPALVLGTSLGAAFGLDLISRHPGQVRLLVAHEPPATGLLPEPERSQATRDQEEVEELYRREGIAAANRKFVAVTGIRFDDREPDAGHPAAQARADRQPGVLPHPRRSRRPPLPAPPARPARGGRPHPCPPPAPARKAFPRHCAQALADELGGRWPSSPAAITGSCCAPGPSPPGCTRSSPTAGEGAARQGGGCHRRGERDRPRPGRGVLPGRHARGDRECRRAGPHPGREQPWPGRR